MKRWHERGLFLAFLLLIGLVGSLSRSIPPNAPWHRALVTLGSAMRKRGEIASRYIHPPEPLLPRGLAVAGLPVGGLSLDEAWAWFDQHRLAPLRQPVSLRLRGEMIVQDPTSLGRQMNPAPVRERLQELVRDWPPRRWAIYLGSGFERTATVSENVPFPVVVDESVLRGTLEELAATYRQDPVPVMTTTLTDGVRMAAVGVDPFWMANRPVAAFVAPAPGWRLDVEASLPTVAAALREGQRGPISLTVAAVPPPEPDMALLETVLRKQIARMPAVVGFYLLDLATGRTLELHAGTIFSAASVMKIAILVQVYRVLDEPPTPQVTRDLEYMMINSDNAAANRLMAVGGEGDAPRGLERMTKMLRQLGLPDSFMCNTYDGGPHWSGCPPKARATAAGEAETDVDEVLQTTPRDMGRLLALLYECSDGRGKLPTEFPGEITAEECQAMIALMQRNADVSRMVAGLPDIPVAHKSGWIDDMKADAGIVFSAGGDYVLSIFIWQEKTLTEWESSRWLARLSWIVYSFFNPL